MREELWKSTQGRAKRERCLVGNIDRQDWMVFFWVCLVITARRTQLILGEKRCGSQLEEGPRVGGIGLDRPTEQLC